MKKYFFMLLAAATLTLGFTACGNDEEEATPKSEKEQDPTPDKPATAEYDLAGTLGMNLQSMMKTYGEPTINFSGIYMYELETGNIASLLFMLNTQTNNLNYFTSVTLKEGAYKPEDIKNYLSTKYILLDTKTEEYEDEETGEIVKSTTYVYGDSKKEEECKIAITYDDNLTITFTDIYNVPEETDDPLDEFNEYTPIEIVDEFLGASKQEILSNYESFIESENMLMAATNGNEYFMTFALNFENDIVNSVVILYNEEFADSDIISYYEENNYTCTKLEETTEEGSPVYVFTSGDIQIVYAECRGVVTKASK